MNNNEYEQTIDITVFTPTYNRERTLIRAYESLCNQTNKNFIWLIIDDGSNDNTKNLVENFSKNSDFIIEYHYKQNGGRHTAVNFSYKYLRTKYVITLDSDDELVEDAIEKIYKIWSNIDKKEYERFWCISGREINAETNQLVGKPYPPGINNLKGRKQRKEILKCPGEKHCCRKVDVHVKYKFPEYSDTKFVTENQVWCKINRQYDQYCVNDVFGKYHTESTDSLSNKGTHSETHYYTYLHSGIFYINEIFDEILFNRAVIISLVNVSRCAILTNTSYKKLMAQINTWYKRIIVTLCYPISGIWVLTHRN